MVIQIVLILTIKKGLKHGSPVYLIYMCKASKSSELMEAVEKTWNWRKANVGR